MSKLFAFLALLVLGGLALVFLLLTASAVIECMQHRHFGINDAIYIAAVAIGTALTAKGAAEMVLRLKRASPPRPS